MVTNCSRLNLIVTLEIGLFATYQLFMGLIFGLKEALYYFHNNILLYAWLDAVHLIENGVIFPPQASHHNSQKGHKIDDYRS